VPDSCVPFIINHAPLFPWLAAFKLTRGSNETANYRIVHIFHPNGIDGVSPMEGVIPDAVGNLYGTTASGGTGIRNGG